MAVKALHHHRLPRVRVRTISNIDGASLADLTG